MLDRLPPAGNGEENKPFLLPATMSSYRIAVAARKGGVGKTTIACGIASVLASKKLRVLVIDLDPQSNAAFILGGDPTQPGTATLLSGQSPQPLAIDDYLAVLPGGPELMNHAIQQLHPEELADAVASFTYDALVFDCPPGNEHLERLALLAATSVLVVTDAHPLALLGAERVLEELMRNQQKKRKGAARWALVQSRIDSRRTMDREFEQALAENFPNIERLRVRQDTQLSLAGADRTPIMTYDPKSRGATDLIAVAEWGIDEQTEE
ncbi:ParA family protein [Microcystis aeruginosa]|nr:ParA family protein [Microcystis aeruginosa]